MAHQTWAGLEVHFMLSVTEKDSLSKVASQTRSWGTVDFRGENRPSRTY